MEYETKVYISIAFMIIFALIAMFFLGYKYAYDKAINYANEELREIRAGEQPINPDVLLGNIEVPGGFQYEKNKNNTNK